MNTTLLEMKSTRKPKKIKGNTKNGSALIYKGIWSC